MLGCNCGWAHGLQPNGPQHCLYQCHMLPRWHHHSISHDLAGLQPCISRWYNCQESPLGGESHLTPPLTNLPPWPVKPLKTTGGSRPEDGVAEAGWPVAPDRTGGNTKCSPNYHLGSHSASMRRLCKDLTP